MQKYSHPGGAPETQFLPLLFSIFLMALLKEEALLHLIGGLQERIKISDTELERTPIQRGTERREKRSKSQ